MGSNEQRREKAQLEQVDFESTRFASSVNHDLHWRFLLCSFGGFPTVFHVVKRSVGDAAALGGEAVFDKAKAPLKLGVGMA